MPWLVHDGKVLATLEVADSRARPDARACSGATASTGRCCSTRPGRSTPCGMRFAIDVAYCDRDLRGAARRDDAPEPDRAARAQGRARSSRPRPGRSSGGGSRVGDRPRDQAAAVDGGEAGRGVLVLVATPDRQPGRPLARAVEELARADVVACEDTRRTGRLLAHAGRRARPSCWWSTTTPRRPRSREVLARLDRGRARGGRDRRRHAGRCPIRASGWCAAAAAGPRRRGRARSVGGHQPRWWSAGWPPAGGCSRASCPAAGSGRTERLAELAGERRTIVLYEAPHRLARTLADLADVARARPGRWWSPAS